MTRALKKSRLCTPYLREQTRTIDPEFIVTLGNFSTKFILKTEVGITRLHGTLQKAGRFKVFPIFHPAAALYDGSKREALENDFATLGQLLRESDAAQSAAADEAAPGAAAAASSAAPAVAPGAAAAGTLSVTATSAAGGVPSAVAGEPAEPAIDQPRLL